MKTDDFLADYERVLRDAAARRLQGTTPARPKPRRAGMLGALAVALVLVVAVLARGEGPSTPPADERPAPTATPTADPGAPRYSVLDRPAEAPLDEERFRDLADDPVLRSKGIEWDQLRTAIVSQGVTAYATRGAEGEACVIASSARSGTTFGCGDPTGHTRAVTLRFALDRDTSIVVGLVPDGAREVELRTGTQAIAARVERNAFIGFIGHEETSVRWHDAAGRHQEQLGPSPLGPSTPDPYSGRRGTQALSATAPDPAGGEPAGMLTYRSRGGHVCMVSGFVREGRLGRYGPDGRFSRLDPAEAPGSCGDLADTLKTYGGVALVTGGALRGNARAKQTIIYGLVASRDSSVRVTWRDGTGEDAVVTPTTAPQDLDGAEGAYVLLSRPGQASGGARVSITDARGALLHTFAF